MDPSVSMKEIDAAIAARAGAEEAAKEGFESTEEKQAYNNDFEVYLTSYANRIRNMVTYGKMDQAEGASILQELQ